MIEETPSSSAVPATTSAPELDTPDRLAARLSRVEAQLRALSDRVGEITAAERTRKQRAVVLRLALLAVLLGLFFVVRARA